ncbi:MAG: VacB/RNase II family 3'-5' exoribonuclease [Deltaproteobacteria bacterium]|nr:VacB/RNase II family 3'-5' exoribonuclease [Deltaproteobacteria bacterium]
MENERLRDQAYWERWLRKNAERLRERLSTVKEWYREAGVEKGERRAFKAALKALEPDGRPAGRRGRRQPLRGKGPVPASDATAGSAPDRRSGDAGRTFEGRLRFTREGRPLVIPEDPAAQAVRIPGHSLAGAWPKDRVVVRIERRRGAAPPYGRVERILERGIRSFVGRYAPTENRSFVRFRDRESDLLLEADLPDGFRADPGELVLAEVTGYPERGREGRARVVRALGKSHTMETIALAVLSTLEIPVDFPEPVAKEAALVPQSVHPEHLEGGERREAGGPPARVDRRDLPFVTIDGEDARDFDDAVCLSPEGDGFRLHVAIADVGHYVSPRSPLDREAYIRGTSVYFPDRCIPMLPRELSEGVCSLKPGKNRLTMNVEVPIRPGGATGAPRFYPSVIRSRARLTYEEVHAFLSGTAGDMAWRKPTDGGIGAETGPMLRNMATAAGWLALARSARGALDFDLPEAKVAVEGGMPVSVAASERWESHRIIEEFMLVANAAVAEFLSRRGDPFLFRIHEEPAAEKVEEFEAVAGRLLRRSRATDRRDVASRLQAWADIARGGKYERPVHMMILRSLMLARYGPETKGHFGLALPRYTHFTSPIRRYPDLVAHRALKTALGDTSLAPYLRALASMGTEIGTHLSARERVAMDAERAVEQRAKALFMEGKVGRVFEGSVSSLSSSGFFVTLADWMVEGMVHVSTLRDDEYRFSADRMAWEGIYRRRTIALGDRVRVRVRRADPDRGEVDFLYVEKMTETP